MSFHIETWIKLDWLSVKFSRRWNSPIARWTFRLPHNQSLCFSRACAVWAGSCGVSRIANIIPFQPFYVLPYFSSARVYNARFRGANLGPWNPACTFQSPSVYVCVTNFTHEVYMISFTSNFTQLLVLFLFISVTEVSPYDSACGSKCSLDGVRCSDYNYMQQPLPGNLMLYSNLYRPTPRKFSPRICYSSSDAACLVAFPKPVPSLYVDVGINPDSPAMSYDRKPFLKLESPK